MFVMMGPLKSTSISTGIDRGHDERVPRLPLVVRVHGLHYIRVLVVHGDASGLHRKDTLQPPSTLTLVKFEYSSTKS